MQDIVDSMGTLILATFICGGMLGLLAGWRAHKKLRETYRRFRG